MLLAFISKIISMRMLGNVTLHKEMNDVLCLTLQSRAMHSVCRFLKLVSECDHLAKTLHLQITMVLSEFRTNNYDYAILIYKVRNRWDELSYF